MPNRRVAGPQAPPFQPSEPYLGRSTQHCNNRAAKLLNVPNKQYHTREAFEPLTFNEPGGTNALCPSSQSDYLHDTRPCSFNANHTIFESNFVTRCFDTMIMSLTTTKNVEYLDSDKHIQRPRADLTEGCKTSSNPTSKTNNTILLQ